MSETKWERIARQRAEFAAYVETTTDEPKLSHVEWISAQITARVAAMPVPVKAPAPIAPTAATNPRRVDRVWAGGDRDSDDIYCTR